ncbi:MAG TPA: BrnT family toxin [Bauldia sp.]|nr:BrnT family toxin [Bauldia sp.]
MEFDFEQIAGFDWDVGNLTKSLLKHGVTASEAEQIFYNQPLLIWDDISHSAGERRFQALGKTNEGRLLFAAFTLRAEGTLLRLISVRPMNVREKARYGQEA